MRTRQIGRPLRHDCSLSQDVNMKEGAVRNERFGNTMGLVCVVCSDDSCFHAIDLSPEHVCLRHHISTFGLVLQAL